MGKRVRLTDDSINCYGTRILTAGIDLSLYEKNPVLLWMHERGQVVGYLKDIERKDGEITAEPVFDMATPLSRQLSKQWEFGSIRMVSVSVDIVETSEDRKQLLPGQTRPTVTKSKLSEVSIVDIGGNDNAVVLTRGGKRIELSADGDCLLPLLNNQNEEQQMDLKKLALSVGLPETATEEEISRRIAELKSKDERIAALEKENEGLKEARIEQMVDGAIAGRRLEASKRGGFIALGKEIGVEKLEGVLSAMSPAVKPSTLVNTGGDVTNAGWKKLSDVPVSERVRLRREEREEYKRLYKAEYGIDCEIND